MRGHSFKTRAVTDDEISVLIEELASKKPDCPKFVLRTDNDSQCISAKFGSVVNVYGIKQKFIHNHAEYIISYAFNNYN